MDLSPSLTDLKAPFDEKSLFPKEVLEQVDKPRHYMQKVTMMRNYGKAIRSMGFVFNFLSVLSDWEHICNEWK